ncbi:hypothetical protein O1611_g3839 [Lasiodiplodia mahajangana]|uniref:Uncharacterized protein n=1 Tax=Lasiodiplodia mahajangana TaxID=1108764 RepID=A0ACC2JQR6_9PEZI|nr:hypothetical protein O1611_g3839 [Lasiodiplodia mahajangana]
MTPAGRESPQPKKSYDGPVGHRSVWGPVYYQHERPLGRERETEVVGVMSRPESEQSSIDISQIEKSFPAPPKSSNGFRKTLPPLPPMAEIERDAAEAIALEKEKNKVTAEPEPKLSSLVRDEPSKGLLPLPFAISTPKSLRPLSPAEPRPATASTRRMSFVSIDPKRNLKYGVGKYAAVELSPQPSEDPNDPLNWPLWKKNLNLLALLSVVAVVGAMKTALVTVHSVIAVQEGVNYTSAVALTAVPLIISALSGMTSTIIARIWGKRPVYLVSMVLMFIGSAWNINTRGSFAQNMAARIFQGLGWGAFDTLEHERQTKILLYHTVSVGTTWGSPVIGGAVSMGGRGFQTQFEIFTTFLVVLMPLIIYGAPETTEATNDRIHKGCGATIPPECEVLSLQGDDRGPSTPHASAQGSGCAVDNTAFRRDSASPRYPLELNKFSLDALCAVAFPTGGIFRRLDLLRTVSARNRRRGRPALVSPSETLLPHHPPSDARRRRHLRVDRHAQLRAVHRGLGTAARARRQRSDMELGVHAQQHQLPRHLIPARATGPRVRADMKAGLTCLRNLIAGAFVLGIPTVVRSWDGLRGSAIATGVVQIFITAVVAAVYFDLSENVRQLDGVVMGLVDLSSLKQRGSFFDSD